MNNTSHYMPLHATLFQKNPTHQSAIIQKKYTKKSGGGSP
ncbi:hypothetical protein BACI349Y_30066 [Bacillus sp. 349Y]|nr:hypothetical protein BACI349Y_30066 [Bacillus sp. 349Y]